MSLNDKIELRKIKHSPSTPAEFQAELEHVENVLTDALTYKKTWQECGEWYDGATLYKAVVEVDGDYKTTVEVTKSHGLDLNGKKIELYTTVLRNATRVTDDVGVDITQSQVKVTNYSSFDMNNLTLVIYATDILSN